MVLRLHSPSVFHALRSYSTAAQPSASSGVKWILAGSAAAGIGYWAFNSQEASKGKNLSKSSSVRTSALSPDEWRNFKLKEVIPYNHNTSTFVFELPKGSDSGLTVASALVTKSAASEGDLSCKEDNGKPAIRPYTPITPPDQQDSLHLLVKKYPSGKMTNHIHSLKPGDELSLKGPIPKWPYKTNEFKTIGMIAGGTGITPHWQIIQDIISNPSDRTKVVLLFANQKEEDILLREELERLTKQSPDQFSIHFVLDDPPKKWSSELKGHLNAAILKSKLPPPELGSDTKIFICGPPGQVGAIAGPKKGKEQGELGGILKELGYSQEQVYKF
ncbi:hypothetical protein BY996DRAFT_7217795 [Phakopsora pachyrhizi]|uniref:cytochrome-b5 reductase n=1 Tax=Phakopsora pachyrhizi TaxID=170000 RepID=A0AAV0BFJ2_PHAPC|nr:hypothetical protein BY996DRAFT_7217795 [Phakopsora pachyrhizi]CAH7685927.1 hypothetical protein PPACK8108_LOCUS20528 [Phakopsora pachyrhizi]